MTRGNRRRGVNLGPRDPSLTTLFPVVLRIGASRGEASSKGSTLTAKEDGVKSRVSVLLPSCSKPKRPVIGLN